MGDKKLCKLIEKLDFEDKKEVEKYREIIKEGKYFCKRCGRVSKDKENLCKPEKI